MNKSYEESLKNSRKEKLYYPISHHFYPILEFDEKSTHTKNYIDHFNGREINTQDNQLYIHIPFCESVCMFCPFHIKVASEKIKIYDEYVMYLIKEMEILAPKIENVFIKAIYFGGGSPSVLSTKNIEDLFNAIQKLFDVGDDVEITFEGEPRTLNNDELLQILKSNGVSRISYGVQTFDPKMRELLKIGASLDDVYKCQEALRKQQFEDVNIDMMYYLPGQSIEDLHKDLNQLKMFGVDSFDYYYLSYYAFPKSYFTKVDNNTVPAKPEEYIRHKMFRVIRDYMKSINYNHKLESFFTLKDTIPEFFRILWGGGDGNGDANTIAIGVSSRGFFNNKAYANYTKLADYYKMLQNRQLPIQSISEEVSPENRGMVFFPKFFNIHEERIPKNYLGIVNELLEEELLKKKSDSYLITDKGLDWLPNITMEFFTNHQKELSDQIVEKLKNHYSNKVTVYG